MNKPSYHSRIPTINGGDSLQKETLKNNLLTLMALRVVFAVLFLGVTAWFQIKADSPFHSQLYPLYTIIVGICFLTIIYLLLLRWLKGLLALAHWQVLFDILIVTAIVYVTGGVDSFLSPLYFLAIISGSIILGRRGGFYAASASSIAYGLIMDLDFYKMLPQEYKVISSGTIYAWDDLLTTIITNILAFFVIAYLTGYLSERTARVEKRLEERDINFKRLEALNNYIVENINSGILTLDRNNRITSFNKTAERLTGYFLRDVYYKDVNEVFPDLTANLASLGSDSLPCRVEKVIRRVDGVELFVGFSISTPEDVDADKIIIFQDLTHTREMEEQLKRGERLKSLGELAVGIAHEVRNPLASMSGSIQVLKEDLKPGDSESGKLMDIILRETERLNELITDFLLFARPAPSKREIVDLRTLLEDILGVFRNSPEANGIDISTGSVSTMLIEGDIRQLKQVFWNIFLNGAQSMPEGGRLEINSQLGSGHTAEITVSDNGKGINQEDMEKIFDPFFSMRESGTGLGLALVHRVIESHGGKVIVNSKRGKGTTFKIILPLAGASEMVG
jgi:two-component system sensor histidine kinase PilS (NtrC family)